MKADELKKKLDKNEQITLIDVREADEFVPEEAVPGSVNVPMGKVFVEAGSGNLSKDKKIVTICKSGGRCGIVARELKAKGFDIEDLEGGIKAWNELDA